MAKRSDAMTSDVVKHPRLSGESDDEMGPQGHQKCSSMASTSACSSQAIAGLCQPADRCPNVAGNAAVVSAVEELPPEAGISIEVAENSGSAATGYDNGTVLVELRVPHIIESPQISMAMAANRRAKDRLDELEKFFVTDVRKMIKPLKTAGGQAGSESKRPLSVDKEQPSTSAAFCHDSMASGDQNNGAKSNASEEQLRKVRIFKDPIWHKLVAEATLAKSRLDYEGVEKSLSDLQTIFSDVVRNPQHDATGVRDNQINTAKEAVRSHEERLRHLLDGMSHLVNELNQKYGGFSMFGGQN